LGPLFIAGGLQALGNKLTSEGQEILREFLGSCETSGGKATADSPARGISGDAARYQAFRGSLSGFLRINHRNSSLIL
jgi:hypothetical protein